MWFRIWLFMFRREEGERREGGEGRGGGSRRKGREQEGKRGR
jgi:hypothetical protein